MDVVVGIDASTTACKAIAFGADGRIVAEGRSPIPLHNPAQDAWQQDAEDWWRALCEACQQLTGKLAGQHRVRAASISNQRETFVLCDDTGQPLHPALVWMDARCKPQVAAAVEAIGGDKLHQLSGKPACTTPSLYKLKFLLEQAPQLLRPSTRVLDVHAFLVWRLSGHCRTSLAAADPLGLVDMQRRCWATELLDHCHLRETQLPELVAPGDAIAVLSESAAAATGLPLGLPLVAGAGDGQAAGLGAGIAAPGRAYLNLGTAVVGGVLSDDYRCDRAFRTLYAGSPGRYFLETDLQGGTFTHNWLFKRLLGLEPAAVDTRRAALEHAASALPAGSKGLLLLPYWNGVMNPHWDDDASGAVLGWRGEHGPEHLYRALLEGIAFEQRLHFEGVEAAVGGIREVVLMGGGSKSALWCQILADVLGKPLVRCGTSEASALGVAMLAAVHVGMHADLASAGEAMVSLGERFQPGVAQPAYDAIYRDVYSGLYPALATTLQRLARLRRGG